MSTVPKGRAVTKGRMVTKGRAVTKGRMVTKGRGGHYAKDWNQAQGDTWGGCRWSCLATKLGAAVRWLPRVQRGFEPVSAVIAMRSSAGKDGTSLACSVGLSQ